MSYALSKIQPPEPRRGQLLARPALEARLREAVQSRRVVLVTAAAGYGKTALLVRTLVPAAPGVALAWVSLDPGDDLHRLLESVLAALEPFDPPWRVAPEGLLGVALGGDVRGRQQAVDDLVNALDASEVARGVIVLDDLHHLADPAAEHFLGRLIERLGARWTLVLSSREPPTALVARVAGAGDLAQFREADLQFGIEEVEAWFSSAGFDAAAVRALHARTAGWAAGLRLAASGARGGGPGTAIDRAAFDFLAVEVLAHLSSGLRNFLLETSVLQELDATRCAALTGDARAAHWLDEIERRGLFATVVDSGTGALRLHDLFRDALRHRLRVERPESWPALLQRAAGIETDPVRRQALLLEAGCLDDAARALLEDAPKLNTSGGVETVLRLVDAFPPAFTADSAELQHSCGIGKISVWRNAEAERHFARARHLYAARGSTERARTMAARRAAVLVALGRLDEATAELDGIGAEPLSEMDGRLMAITAAMWLRLERGEYDAVAALFSRLVDLMSACSTVPEWSTVPPPRQIACRGMVVPLRRWAAGALAVVGDRPLPLRAMATIALGWGALWQGQPRAAEEYLAQADAEARWIGNEVISRNHGSGLHAVLALLRGDRDRAVQIARERIDSLPAGYGEWGRWHGLYFSARIAAACGAAAVLQEWLRELQALAPRLVEVSAARLRPVAGLAGTLAALEGRFDAARSHWAEVLAHEGNADLLGQAGEVRIRQALLDARSGALDAAATLLRPLLGTPDDGPRGAIYAVPEVVELARTEWSGRLDGARLATLQAWAATLAPATIAVVTAPLDGNAERSPERLTGREVEVVALIARGVSNKLIARELDLSPHTVKRHVANTLAKLGVASRGEAAAWYHAQRGRVHDA